MSNDQCDIESVNVPAVEAPTTGIEWIAVRSGRKYEVRGSVSDITLVDEINLMNDAKRRAATGDFARRFTERGVMIDETLVYRELEDLAARQSNGTIADEDVEPEALLLAIGLMVLCTEKDGALFVYSTARRMQHEIPDVSKLSYLRLIQMIGDELAELVSEGKPTDTTVFTLDQIKKALAAVSHAVPRRESLRMIGQGIHDVGDDTILIVNGDELYRFDLSTMTIESTDTPLVGDHMIRFGDTAWCPGLLESFAGATQANIAEWFGELVHYIEGDRNWSHPWDPWIIAALIVATFVQDCLPWRPMVGLTGPTGCGKSILCNEKICVMFGDLSLSVNIPTEAGLRQGLAENKLPVVIDEFDSCVQIPKILEMMRSSGHGGTIIRGSQSHGVKTFHIRHIIWTAGIQLGMFKEQDFNRFIRLEIPPFVLQSDRGYTPPSGEEIDALRTKIIALALRILPQVREMVGGLADVAVEGVPHRMVQNYALPAAIHTIATQDDQATPEEAEATLRGMLEGREMPEVLRTGTEQELLRDILYSKVQDGTTGMKFVNDIIVETCSLGTNAGSNQALHQFGLKIIVQRGTAERSLFIVPKLVTQYLLKDTSWAKMELEPILRRIPGATRSQQRLNAPSGVPEAGNQIRGYLIPLSSIIGDNNNETE